MIDVRQAVQAAVKFAEALYGDKKQIHPTLEEVELTEDERHWLITLGFPKQNLSVVEALSGNGQRDYKIFTVNSQDGKVISMKIRSVA
jgi:hypothetical protein